jgi:hypothetical protein
MADLGTKRVVNLEKVKNLLMQAVVDLEDAKITAVSVHRRFVAAYEAALHCALAVRELKRVETRGEGHHVETLSQLVSTLGLKGPTPAEILTLCQARNDVTYKGKAAVADEAMVVRTLGIATRLLDETEGWIKKNHPIVFSR